MIDTGRVPLSNVELDLYRQGISAAATGSLIEAIEYYDRLLEVRVDFWEGWYERGTVLEDLGQFADAIASYDKALSLESNREALENLWLRRGNAYQYGLGEYDAALACYDRVLQLQPAQVQGWHHRGNALLYGYQQPEAAIICYRHALDTDPQLASTWRNQGNAFMDLRRYSDAIVSYDHSLAISPNDKISAQARHQAQHQLGLMVQPPDTKPAWLVPEWREGQGRDALAPSLDRYDLTPVDLFDAPLNAASLLLEDEENCSFIQLVENIYTIGRHLDNKICLRSQFSSRFHAVIRRLMTETGEVIFEIQDGSVKGKASKNGILVNGKPVTRVFLNHQDLIVFGPSVRAIFRAF